MKYTVSILLILCTLFTLAACGSPSDPAETQAPHIHSFRDWTVVSSPTLKQNGTKERMCSCGEKETVQIPSKYDELSDFMMKTASDYSNGSYTVSENAKTFGKDCKLIYPGYRVDEGMWSINLTFNPTTKETIFLISRGNVSSMLESLAFVVQDGVVVDRYDYIFQSENFKGGYKDQIYGSIYPSSLNRDTYLYYSTYSAGSGKAFTYFVENYQKDACAFAKQLVIFFDAYFEYKGLSLRMGDFGFSQ